VDLADGFNVAVAFFANSGMTKMAGVIAWWASVERLLVCWTAYGWYSCPSQRSVLPPRIYHRVGADEHRATVTNGVAADAALLRLWALAGEKQAAR